MLDLAAIASEIEAGLPNERDRLDAAKINLDFYRGDFDAYLDFAVQVRRYGNIRDESKPRTSLFMQRIIGVLTQHLYSKGPAREFTDNPDLTTWLQEQYTREGVDGTLQECDRLAFAARVAAIQAVGSGEAARPVRYQVWPADQFVAWVDPANPTVAAVVATIDLQDNQRRLRLWTAETLSTYLTAKLDPGQTAGGTAYSLQSVEPNYYGCVPFAFVHANSPTTDFWNHAPGDTLRLANDYLNHDLTDTGGSIRFLRRPVVKAFGAQNDPPAEIYPGLIWHVQPSGIAADGNGIPPDVEYLQPDGSFVEVTWADLQGYIDHTLECLGIPTSAFRMVDQPAASGIAIVIEQLPLISFATGRQRAFLAYERQLARATIQVGAAELGRLGAAAPATLDPDAVARLTLRWPSMVPEVPMTAVDQATVDADDLAMGITTRLKIVMRRLNLSREEALAYLESIADDLKDEERIGLPPVAPAKPAAAPPNPEDDHAASRSQPEANADDPAGQSDEESG